MGWGGSWGANGGYPVWGGGADGGANRGGGRAPQSPPPWRKERLAAMMPGMMGSVVRDAMKKALHGASSHGCGGREPV